MFYWSSFPLVRLVIPFLSGIICYEYVPIENLDFSFLAVLTISFFIIGLIFHLLKLNYSARWANGVVTALLFISLGYLYCFQVNESTLPPKTVCDKKVKWIGEVESITKKNGRIHSIELGVGKYHDGERWVATSFNLLAYVKGSNLDLTPGDLIADVSFLRHPNSSENPAQFDYRNFLDKKYIYLVSSITSPEKIGFETSLSRLAFLLREKVVLHYQSWSIEKDEMAVLTALTLGDKSQLSGEIREAFAGAGAMHVLAVSGLHVGIIFLLFTYVLKLLPEGIVFKWLKMVLLLLAVWSFALLSGFSLSVQRASWMFSFIIVSNTFGRNSHVLNSIAASAFLVILIDPKAIFQLGFQLSYSAVIGIVLIYPKLSNLFVSRYRSLNYAWELMVVSFAAQLATLPLTLYYFHQFPVYAFLTNLIVIPLSFLIVALTVIALLIDLLIASTLYVGAVVDILLKTLNYSVEYIFSLPYSTIGDIWIEEVALILLVSGIILFVSNLYTRSNARLKSSLLAILFFLITETAFTVNRLFTKRVTFYQLASKTVSFTDGLKSRVYSSDTLSEFDRMIVYNHLKKIDVEEISWINRKDLKKQESILHRFNGKLFYFREKGFNLSSLDEIDCVIIDHDTNVKELSEQEDLLIIDYARRDSSVFQMNNLKSMSYFNLADLGAKEIIF